MKEKVFCLFVAFILTILPITSFAEYTTMSDEELSTAINQMRVELTKRKLNPDNTICDSDGLTISISGNIAVEQLYDGSYELIVKYIAVNNADDPISYSFDEVCINGWEVSCLEVVSLDAGKKTKGQLEIYSIDEEADITKVEDIEDIEFYGHTYDSTSYHTITDNLRMKVIFK